MKKGMNKISLILTTKIKSYLKETKIEIKIEKLLVSNLSYFGKTTTTAGYQYSLLYFLKLQLMTLSKR